MSPSRGHHAARAVRWLAVLLAMSAAAPAVAGQKAKWWRSEAFQRELQLTPEQVSRLDQIFHESWPALQQHKQDLDRLETELSQLIADSSADESSVVQMIDRVEASRSALGRTRSLMLFRMHRVLSAAQRTALKALHDAAKPDLKDSGSSSR
jgi:Spy/CpxP family protein refolding chaperone